jgi:hypothetical protein
MTTLERDLKLSIQFEAMRSAIKLALPLLKKEYESIRVLPSIAHDKFLAGEYRREAEQWREAMSACERALEPVLVAAPVLLEVVR